MEFSLSSRGLISAARMCTDNDFTFTVGSYNYLVSRFFAGYISPVISQMSLTDPFISSFEISINDPSREFQKILDLQSGNAVSFDDCEFLILIGKALGNEEILEHGIKIKNAREELSITNVISRLQTKLQYSIECEEEISFISCNFSKIDKKMIQKLKVETIEKIISNPLLRLDNEVTLFSFVEELIRDNGNSFHKLLNCIHFEFLTTKEMERVLKLINPEDISGPIWCSLCKRILTCDAQENTSQKVRYRSRETEIKPDQNNIMHGILWTLSQKYGGNVHSNGIIEITSSTTEHNEPYEVANEDWQDYWYSKEESFPWIQFNFKNISVKPTNYSLKSFNCASGYSHIKSWVLEGSNDGSTWTVLDNQVNSSSLNHKRATALFNCEANESYHMLRIKMTGKNHHNGTYMCLAGADFFGTMKE